VPLGIVLLTLVAQPLAMGHLCAPCLLESLFALAVLECRAPAGPPLSDIVDTRFRKAEAWRGRIFATPIGVRRLGRDDTHR
jgi:hypothetical protein